MKNTGNTAILETVHIVSTPGVLGGKPRIEGTRISVEHVVEHHVISGWSVEELAEAFGLTLAQIYAALSYYYDHREEIDRVIREKDKQVAQMRTEQKTLVPEDDILSQIITAAAAARMFNLSDRTVRDAIEQGKIRAVKSGGTWLIRRDEAEARWGKRK